MPYKKINNFNLYYEESGKGEIVLFIHGLGSSSKDWEYQISHFSKNHKTISVDLRGHGNTGSVDGVYTMKIFSKDIFSIIHENKTPVHIIGISMGGCIALQFAADNPLLVKTLTIINSFVELPLSDKRVRKGLRMRKIIPRIIGMKAMGIILGKKVFPKENQKKLRKLIAKRWAKNTVKDYIKSVNAIADWTIKDRLTEIKCPVLILGAEFDYLSVEEKKEYTKLFPNAEFTIIPDSYHVVTMEKPDEVNTVISDFIEKQS